MEINFTLKELIEIGNELIGRIVQHPAVIKDGDCKQEKIQEGDLLDDIDVANTLVAEAEDKIRIIFKHVRNSYSKRYPELFVTEPLHYMMTVQLLENKPERVSTDENIKTQLAAILDPKMYLLVTMTAATTQGIKLEHEEMSSVLHACNIAVNLNELRLKLLGFVERNMATIAPNLSVIVGASIAARLMGLVGGLKQLAEMPSCNLPTKNNLIYESDLIKAIPFDYTKDVRKRAVKWIANKCILAARCDISQSNPDGKAGRIFREKIETLIDKELEPPPKKAARPLPVPVEKSGKKRGGKRVRRMKERYAPTELRRMANRIDFGDLNNDAYQNEPSFGLGKLRAPVIDDRTKIKLSKSAQKKLVKAKQQSETRLMAVIASADPTSKPSTSR